MSHNTLYQGWATLFGSRATLETNLVYAGHNKYPKDIFIDKTMFFINFLKISILRGILVYKKNLLKYILINFKKIRGPH